LDARSLKLLVNGSVLTNLKVGNLQGSLRLLILWQVPASSNISKTDVASLIDTLTVKLRTSMVWISQLYGWLLLGQYFQCQIVRPTFLQIFFPSPTLSFFPRCSAIPVIVLVFFGPLESPITKFYSIKKTDYETAELIW